MTLYEAPSQYREKIAVWRILSLLTLYAPLAEAKIWRWFAVNIPMDLGTGGKFTSEIDIIASLRPHNRKTFLYKTFEVKVSLLNADGTTNSLKGGKTLKILKQLQAHRDYGSPDVTLLEVYICAPGFLRRHTFPTAEASDVIRERIPGLIQGGFGYWLLPFEHGKDKDWDIGLSTLPGSHSPGPAFMEQSNFRILSPIIGEVKEPFSLLVRRLHDFFDSQGRFDFYKRIVFCRECRRLGLINMKGRENPHRPGVFYPSTNCPHCGDDLISQS